nr:hypothetical protein [uncultured Cellulosilyticum sp.]
MGVKLKSLTNRFWNFEVADDEVYHIKKPDFDVAKKLRDKNYEGNNELCLSLLEDLTLNILNNNVEKKKFTKQWLKDNGVDYMVQSVIVMDYTNWVNEEIVNNPNFKSLTR